MTQEIKASFTELVEQAPLIANIYMRRAVDQIDQQFGDGFAQKNPGLVGAFMQTAALDEGFAVLAQQLRAGLDSVADNIPDMEPIADALKDVAGNVGVGWEVSEALERIADALGRVAYGLCDGGPGDVPKSVPNALCNAARIIAGSDV